MELDSRSNAALPRRTVTAAILLILAQGPHGVAEEARVIQNGSRWSVANESLERVVETKPFLRTIAVVNRLTRPARRHAVDSRGFVISVGAGLPELTAAEFEVGKPESRRAGDAVELVVPLICPKHGIRVRVTYGLGRDDFYLRKVLEIDPGAHLVKWVDVESLHLGEIPLERFDRDPMPFRMVPWDIRVGRPLFAGGELFLGVEHPASINAFDASRFISLRQHPGRKGKVVSSPSVIGVCPDRPRERLSDYFQRYVDENRARPVKRSVHWIAYFHAGMDDDACRQKIAVAERVFRERNAPIDLVLMDSGWTDPQSIMGISRQRPDRLALMSKLVRERLGTQLGLHVITSGVKPMVDKDWLAAQRYDMIYHESKRKGAYCFADPRVFSIFREHLLDYVKEHGVVSYKFDWGHFQCGQAGHRGHLPGLEYGFEAGANNFLRVHQALRESRPDLFLFNTGWYSPWWLWTYDAVFSAGADYNFGLAGPPSFSTASLLCTWRDATIRGNLVRWSPYFPLNSLMTVDPISYWWHDWDVRAESPLRPFSDYFITACLRGTQMTEIYNNIAAWSDAHADAAVEILKWMKAHDEVILASTRFFGGDPLAGEPYGYAHFTGENRGIIVVRNPTIEPRKISIPLDETTGMWPGESEYVVRMVYPYTMVLPEVLRYSSRRAESLFGHEVRVFEVWPLDALPEPMPIGCRYQVAARASGETTLRLAGRPDRLHVFSPVPPRGGTPVSGQPGRYAVQLPDGPAGSIPASARATKGVRATLGSLRVRNGQCLLSVRVPDGARAGLSFLFPQRGVQGEVELNGKPVRADAPQVRLADAGNRPRGTQAAAADWSLFGVDVPPGGHELRFRPDGGGSRAALQQVRVLCDTRRTMAAEHELVIHHAPLPPRDEVLLPQNWAWQERFVALRRPAALAREPGLGRLDLDEAARVLKTAEFDFPAQAKGLWRPDDGLPAPEHARFADAAARFLARHPVTPAHERGPALWDVDRTASRQLKCLAYLAAGKQEARGEVAGLCVAQAMRLQWTLPVRTGHRRSPDRELYAAASALSATGALVRASAQGGSVACEVGTQWLRTGLGQVETYGRNGNAAQIKAAAALTGAVSARAEDAEIHGTDREFFAQIDTDRPELAEVAKRLASGDLEGAKQAYVQALSARFSRERGWPDINFWKTVDLKEADDICRNIFVIRAHMHRRYDYGKAVDWAKVIDKDIESRVWMNHHPWAGALADAYEKTGDDKYVKHLCRLFNSWYETSPPTFRRSSAQWRTLEVGGRPGQRWGVVLLALSEHPVFQRESLFNMARSMLDHGKYLSMYAAGGGNWLQVESSGLACVALLFPEFKLSPLFYETAMQRLARVNAVAFLPDGFQSECSPGYHYFPLRGIASAMRLGSYRDAPIPESLAKQYEAGVEVLQYISYPDQTLPMLSDWNPHRSSAIGVLETGADVFHREDFRWLATGGRKGRPPVRTSHDFTHAGYCVMRDRWGPDGQMLIFDAGYFGSGHQHEDKLNFVYYAGGRELIGDPGIYSYKRDEFEPYWRGTWSHNTVVIDGLSQHRALGPPEKIPDPDRRFVMSRRFDFAVGWYRRAYSPRRSALWDSHTTSDREAAVRDMEHQRCIFYLKGRWAVVCDRVLGEGEHEVDILFHPAPVITGEGTRRTARAAKLEVRADGVVVTEENAHANVAILPARGRDMKVLDLIGREDPVRGWFALYAIVPSHDIVYRSRAKLPEHFETVVEPLPPGDVAPMEVDAVKVKSDDAKACAALSCGRDLFLISYEGPTEMTCGEIRFHGTALLLARDASGRPLEAHMVDGKRLALGGRRLFAADTPTPARSLELR